MKQTLERIWRDNLCRMPLNRIRWTNEYLPGSTQEGPALYYSRGSQTQLMRGKNYGKAERKSS